MSKGGESHCFGAKEKNVLAKVFSFNMGLGPRA